LQPPKSPRVRARFHPDAYCGANFKPRENEICPFQKACNKSGAAHCSGLESSIVRPQAFIVVVCTAQAKMMPRAAIEGANVRSIAGPVHAPATNPKPLVPLNRSLVVTAVLAGLIVAATFWLVGRNQSDAAWVVRSLAVRDELTNVVNQVEAAETGQRGYLLTGRDSYPGYSIHFSPPSPPVRVPVSASARPTVSSSSPAAISRFIPSLAPAPR